MGEDGLEETGVTGELYELEQLEFDAPEDGSGVVVDVHVEFEVFESRLSRSSRRTRYFDGELVLVRFLSADFDFSSE